MTWQHRCVHCEVSFPCKSGFDAACKRVQEEESERRVVAVTGLCAAICSVKDGGPRAPVFCWLGRCHPLLSGVFGALCGGRIDCLRFPVVIVVGSNAVRAAVAHLGVSRASLAFSVALFQ